VASGCNLHAKNYDGRHPMDHGLLGVAGVNVESDQKHPGPEAGSRHPAQDPDADRLREINAESFHKLADLVEDLKAVEEKERTPLLRPASTGS
jgi:hypothetical protein